MATARPRPQVMRLTEAAAERIKAVMAKADRPIAAVRVGVKNGGCAGMAYTMEYAEEVNPLDEVIEDKGVRILIDPKAVLFLLGTEMDYKVDKLVRAIRLQQSEPDRGLRLRRIGADRTGARRNRRRGAVIAARARFYATRAAACADGLRIGLADDAIAAVALGRIKAFVGALDQNLRRVARAQHRDADRNRHAAETLAARSLHQFLGHDRAADVVGDRDRRLQAVFGSATTNSSPP